MAGSIPDQDESVRDIADQKNRPADTAFRQQRIRSWNPYLDPIWVICTFFAIGAIFVPTGECLVFAFHNRNYLDTYDAHIILFPSFYRFQD